MLENSTSTRLRQLMEERQITQIEIYRAASAVAEQYGEKLSKGEISNYVKGKIQPKQKKLAILSEALGVNPAWLMGLDVGRTTSIASSTHRIAAGAGTDFSDAEPEVYDTHFPSDRYQVLHMNGDSMAPKIEDGDTLILQRTEASDGDITAVSIGDAPPIIREVRIDPDGNIMLIPYNAQVAKPQMYTAEQRESIPVRLSGKLVEIRRSV